MRNCAENQKWNEKNNSYHKIPGTELEIPVKRIQGCISGKTVLITSGIHSAEYTAIETAMELMQELREEKTNGTIIFLPLVNVSGFLNRTISMVYEDNKNLNRMFPGKREGSCAEKISYEVTNQFIKKCDYYIDLHGGDDYETLCPHVYYVTAADRKTAEFSRKMAQETNVPYRVASEILTGGAYNYASSIGIPSVLIERGGMGIYQRDDVEKMKKDVRKVLDFLGIYRLEKSEKERNPEQQEFRKVLYETAPVSGVWHPFMHSGDAVKKEMAFGVIRDFLGQIIYYCTAKEDGRILYQTESLNIRKGESLVAMGIYDTENMTEKSHAYWIGRASTYADVNKEELSDHQKNDWQKLLEKQIVDHFRERERKSIKVLDIGTGPGFLAILAARSGFDVTAIDFTAEMLQEAKVNCVLEGLRKGQICFRQMDAQKPEFLDQSFDVIITRNLTWNLEYPDQAYKEWHRILKKDGQLMNFDADWYGYLCDETKREAFEHDRKNVKDHHYVDQCIGSKFDVCEEIAGKIPLSYVKRPEWDMKVLKKIGFSYCSADLNVWEKVWSDDKKVNFASTPLFEVIAVK